jgi:Ca2+-transporting ATPase
VRLHEEEPQETRTDPNADRDAEAERSDEEEGSTESPTEKQTEAVHLAGLTSAEARQLLASVGANVVVPERKTTGFVRVLSKSATDPMALLLAGAAVVYWLLGETLDAWVAAFAVLPIVAVGVALELRSERALEELRKTTRPTATVVRDERILELPTEEIVPGDLVIVREGDVVPADCLVVETRQLSVDEAALTGESLPNEKTSLSIPGVEGVLRRGGGERSLDLEIDDSKKVFAGTTVVSGSALAVVLATGRSTRYGALAAGVESAEEPRTPLQNKIRTILLRAGVVAAFFCAATFAVQLAYGRGLAAAITAAVSLGLAAVPEEFALVFAIYLSLGAYRLAKRNALVKRLASVEALGSTTVICTDKTGTLTEGKLAVGSIWCPGWAEPMPAEGCLGFLKSSNDSKSPRVSADSSAISRERPEAGASSKRALRARELLEAAVLATERESFDPLDEAIQRFAREAGVDVEGLLGKKLVVDYGFDQRARYMSHVWELDGGHLTCAKGSPEDLLDRCVSSPVSKTDALAVLEQMASAGMRVVAVAAGRIEDGQSPGTRSVDESGLEFLGFVGFSDPIREGVREAVATCLRAGIDVKLVTGDHPATALAVAKDLGLLAEAAGPVANEANRTVLLGTELDELDDRELAEQAKKAVVFARIRPEQKLRLVRALQSRKEVVAMTGDGINDAPALKEATVGVAMGMRGTQVAKAAADMILLDDNFATIEASIEDGRRIFDNLSRAFSYLVSFHVPLLLVALLVPLAGLPIVLLPVHMVALELVLHPTVSLAFEAEPAGRDVMARPPVPPDEELLSKAQFLGAVFRGFVVFLAAGATFIFPLWAGMNLARARSISFLTLIFGVSWLLLAELAADRPTWQLLADYRRAGNCNRMLAPLLAGTVIFGLASVYFRPLADVMHLEPVPAIHLALVLGATIAVIAFSESAKLLLRKSEAGTRPR